MLPTNIDEVLQALDAIIIQESQLNSSLVFFPILYRKVTARIKLGISENEFEDNLRMENLDVIFANRFLNAYYKFKKGEEHSSCWSIAFNAAEKESLLIMQHLLLGINAHINLDLGIAASQTIGPTNDLNLIKNDFDKINEVLQSMVAGVEAKIASVSPIFFLLDKFGKGKEDMLITFSINLARKGAWKYAEEFHITNDAEENVFRRDTIIAKLANTIANPKSKFLLFIVKVVRFFENKNTKDVALILSAE